MNNQKFSQKKFDSTIKPSGMNCKVIIQDQAIEGKVIEISRGHALVQLDRDPRLKKETEIRIYVDKSNSDYSPSFHMQGLAEKHIRSTHFVFQKLNYLSIKISYLSKNIYQHLPIDRTPDINMEIKEHSNDLKKKLLP